MSDTPEARLARWAERDAVVGLDAEREQLALALAAREAEVADLRARNEQLAQRAAQLAIDADALRHQVAALQRPALTRRVYRRLRTLAARALPH